MPNVEGVFNREHELVMNPSTEESNVPEIEKKLQSVEQEQNAKVQWFI
jgi:hypothetical protein